MLHATSSCKLLGCSALCTIQILVQLHYRCFSAVPICDRISQEDCNSLLLLTNNALVVNHIDGKQCQKCATDLLR